MMISFGDDAFDAFVRFAQEIPDGYIVALLQDGQDPPDGDLVPGVDVRFRGADHDGVQYQDLDAEGELFAFPIVRTRAWPDVARIHVY